MFRPVRTVAPASEPITRDLAKSHLAVDFDDDDDLIDTYIAAVIDHLDGHNGILGRAMINQTWEQKYGGFSQCMRLPFPDVSSVTVSYLDAEGEEQAVSSSLYELLEDETSAYIRFKNSFSAPVLDDDTAQPVTVSMVTGYGASAAAVPAGLRAGLLLLVGYMYQNRGDATEMMAEDMPYGARIMINKFRRVGK